MMNVSGAEPLGTIRLYGNRVLHRPPRLTSPTPRESTHEEYEESGRSGGRRGTLPSGWPSRGCAAPGSGAAASDASAESRNRWRAVTVNKPAAEVAPAGILPEPLAALDDRVEVRITAAPDGKSTEIAARLRAPEPSGPAAVSGRLAGSDPRQAVRSALRESKALIETGEVLRVRSPAGQRTPTPGGKLLDAVTRRARAEGVL